MNEDRLFRQLFTSLVFLLVILPLSLLLLWQVRALLYPVVTALLCAYLLFPFVKLAARFGIPKGLVIFTIIFCILGSLFLVAYRLVPAVRDELKVFTGATTPETASQAIVPRLEAPSTDSATLPSALQSFDAPWEPLSLRQPPDADTQAPGPTFRGSAIDSSLPSLPPITLPTEEGNAQQAKQATEAAKSRLIQIIQELYQQLYDYGIVKKKHLENDEIVQLVSGWLAEWSIPVLSSIGKQAVKWGQFLMIFLFVMIFALLDGNKFYKVAVALIPNSYFETGLFILNKTEIIMGFYLRGLAVETVFLTIIAFILLGTLSFFTPLTLVGAALIALIISLTNIIRIVGPIIGGFVGVFVVVLTTPHIPTMVGVILVTMLVQLADNVLVLPIVMQEQVDVHPVVVLLGVIAGGTVAGVLGMVLAIPVIAGFKIIYRVMSVEIKRYEAESPDSFQLEPGASWE